MGKIVNFVKECYGELKKVNWPSREDVVSQTVVVVVSLLFVSVALAIIDFAAFRMIESVIILGR